MGFTAGQRLQKKRSERAERSFAPLYDTGGMRRVHLRGRDNILKRLPVQAAAFNLSLILRQMLGTGKPRPLQGVDFDLFELYITALVIFDMTTIESLTSCRFLYLWPRNRD